MAPSDKPTHQFLANIQSGETVFENVPVKAFLPRRITEPLRLVLNPPKKTANAVGQLFEFSLTAEVQGYSGKVETRYEAKEIYSEGSTTTSWGLDLQETHMEAVPYDFARLEIRHNPEIPQGEVSGRFWLTPCQLLSPAKIVGRSYTGEVKVETVNQLRFALHTGLQLSFDLVYRHFDEENGDLVSFAELVANFKDANLIGTANNIQEKCVDALDDFLLLSSFAARQRCICLGWESTDSAGHITFYRRGFTLPEPRPNVRYDDTLVSKKDFQRFLEIGYPKLVQIEPKEFIRQAFYAITAEGRTVELKFIRLFSSLETLVLKHRRDTNTEFIFSQNEWKELEKELSKAVKINVSDKVKRSQIYENLSGLNRIAFRTAFSDFCNYHRIDLSDLWPVFGKGNTVSLTEIRNRLVHGVPLNDAQLSTVCIATDHLEWVLERVLLAMLGWASDESRTSPSFLCNMTSYVNWKGLTLDG